MSKAHAMYHDGPFYLAGRNMLLEAQRARMAAQDVTAPTHTTSSPAHMSDVQGVPGAPGLGAASAGPGSLDADDRRVSFGGALAALHAQRSGDVLQHDPTA